MSALFVAVSLLGCYLLAVELWKPTKVSLSLFYVSLQSFAALVCLCRHEKPVLALLFVAFSLLQLPRECREEERAS